MRKLLESIVAAAQMALHLALGPVLHRWRTRWGASRFERHCALPGDDLVLRPAWSYTHAIGIDAPREAVWPWLAQIGQGRGGFYSYELLENLAGCRIHNVLELRSCSHSRSATSCACTAPGTGPQSRGSSRAERSSWARSRTRAAAARCGASTSSTARTAPRGSSSAGAVPSAADRSNGSRGVPTCWTRSASS